eukprot:351501-Chlamydomonas_euryale.AAC.2
MSSSSRSSLPPSLESRTNGATNLPDVGAKCGIVCARRQRGSQGRKPFELHTAAQLGVSRPWRGRELRGGSSRRTERACGAGRQSALRREGAWCCEGGSRCCEGACGAVKGRMLLAGLWPCGWDRRRPPQRRRYQAHLKGSRRKGTCRSHAKEGFQGMNAHTLLLLDLLGGPHANTLLLLDLLGGADTNTL